MKKKALELDNPGMRVRVFNTALPKLTAGKPAGSDGVATEYLRPVKLCVVCAG